MNIHLQRHNHIQQKINSIADEEKLFIQQDLVASDADITYIENHLKLRLTASYQWFLKVYGAGGVNGVFIAGMGTFEHRYAVVEETLNFRVEHPKLSQEFVFFFWNILAMIGFVFWIPETTIPPLMIVQLLHIKLEKNVGKLDGLLFWIILKKDFLGVSASIILAQTSLRT